MMHETCWESVDNKRLTVASCWFSLSLHKKASVSNAPASWATWHDGNSMIVLQRRYTHGITTAMICLVLPHSNSTSGTIRCVYIHARACITHRNVIRRIRSVDSATSLHTWDYSFVEPVRNFMALFKERISVVLLWSFHRKVQQGVGLVSYRKLLLTHINQTQNHFFFTERWYYNMSLSQDTTQLSAAKDVK